VEGKSLSSSVLKECISQLYVVRIRKLQKLVLKYNKGTKAYPNLPDETSDGVGSIDPRFCAPAQDILDKSDVSENLDKEMVDLDKEMDSNVVVNRTEWADTVSDVLSETLTSEHRKTTSEGGNSNFLSAQSNVLPLPSTGSPRSESSDDENPVPPITGLKSRVSRNVKCVKSYRESDSPPNSDSNRKNRRRSRSVPSVGVEQNMIKKFNEEVVEGDSSVKIPKERSGKSESMEKGSSELEGKNGEKEEKKIKPLKFNRKRSIPDFSKILPSTSLHSPTRKKSSDNQQHTLEKSPDYPKKIKSKTPPAVSSEKIETQTKETSKSLTNSLEKDHKKVNPFEKLFENVKKERVTKVHTNESKKEKSQSNVKDKGMSQFGRRASMGRRKHIQKTDTEKLENNEKTELAEPSNGSG